MLRRVVIGLRPGDTRKPEDLPEELAAEGDLAWVPRIAKGAGPVYLAIADALAEDIPVWQAWPRAWRLLPQRTLADLLDIDFTTVTRAYTEAPCKFGSAT